MKTPLRRGLVVAGVLLAAGSAALLQVRRDLRDEISGLRAARDSAQARAGDARLQQTVDRIRLELEGARVRATAGTQPHLALAITDAQLTLERGDIVLRAVPVKATAAPGVRTIARVGEREIVLSDSVRIYAGAAGDTTPPGPGSVRLSGADFAAVAPNVRAGLTAYFF
jgi:hypothetical protein